MNKKYDSLNPLLSIVIPVYNTASYLKKCIDSVIMQSYKNTEIIIINDNSSDNSEKIILEYINKNKNIVYKKLENNRGVGYIRELGTNMANGELVAFIDSDDWVELDFYEKLVKSIVRNSCDIAVGSVLTEFNNFISTKPRYKINEDNVITGDFALKVMTKYYKQGFDISPNMNNRIYSKKVLINNNVFSEYSKQAQDNYSSFMVLLSSDKVALVPNAYYHYYQRENSAVHSFSENYINNYFNVLSHIQNDLINTNRFMEYKEIFMSFVDRSVIWLSQCMTQSKSSIKEQKNFIKLIYKRSLELFSFEEYIDYFDVDRINRMFIS